MSFVHLNIYHSILSIFDMLTFNPIFVETLLVLRIGDDVPLQLNMLTALSRILQHITFQQ